MQHRRTSEIIQGEDGCGEAVWIRGNCRNARAMKYRITQSFDRTASPSKNGAPLSRVKPVPDAVLMIADDISRTHDALPLKNRPGAMALA